ncbi:hypothetical protein HYU13_04985 [Candidatus Woesearchaeota archaeon]|nr:hypothetical protein [Candidatus Woesearchaeota archaeon]
MPKTDYETLLRTGFRKKGHHALAAIAHQDNEPMFRYMDELLYWILLIIAIVGNLIISIILIPFLLSFKNIPLYFTVMLMAMLFGYLFDLLLRDVQSTGRQYVVPWLFIPTIAVIDMYYMVTFANFITTSLNLPARIHNPFALSFVYVIAFSLPYAVHNLLLSQEKQMPAVA